MYKKIIQATKRLKLTKRRLVILIGLIFLLAAGFFLIKQTSGPAKGKVTMDSEVHSVTQASEYIRHDGKHASFAYPKNYRFEKGGISVPILESYRLVASAKGISSSRTIAITVFNLPDAKLENNSSYKIRKDNPLSYKEEVKTVNGKDFIFFKKSGENSTVAFTQRGNLLATIGFSGAVAVTGAEEEYAYVIGSWQWL